MTAKEAILEIVEVLPEDRLSELADYANLLGHKEAIQSSPMALASERTLAKDWLRPGEDKAWKEL